MSKDAYNKKAIVNVINNYHLIIDTFNLIA